MDKPYVDTIGFLVVADCQQDVSGATGIAFRIRKPSGVEIVRTAADGVATCVIDGTVRGIKYATKTGDLSEPGPYKIHAFLTLGDWTGPGEVGTLTVRPLYA